MSQYDSIMDELRDMRHSFEAKLEKVADRIGALERWKSRMLGAASVITLGAVFVIGWLKDRLVG